MDSRSQSMGEKPWSMSSPHNVEADVSKSRYKQAKGQSYADENKTSIAKVIESFPVVQSYSA